MNSNSVLRTCRCLLAKRTPYDVVEMIDVFGVVLRRYVLSYFVVPNCELVEDELFG